MEHRVAIVGAGVSGLTCGVLFAEHGYRTAIFAKETGQQTTSGAAAALWFPYDAEPAEKVIPWALHTYKVLVNLICHRADWPRRAKISHSGVSMIELRQFSRTSEIQIPDWAIPLGASVIPTVTTFKSGFKLNVPLMDTTIYLDYLANRFIEAGGEVNADVHLEKLEDVSPAFNLVINCAGIGARELVQDIDLEPHRGQVAIVPKVDNLSCAIVCDDPPLMYAIPRAHDCVFGGTNEISDNLDVDAAATPRIIDACSRARKKFSKLLIAQLRHSAVSIVAPVIARIWSGCRGVYASKRH